MKFCRVCGRVLYRDFSTGVVVFRCACGETSPAGPDEARIFGGGGAAHGEGFFAILAAGAPFDPTTMRVLRDCPDCGLPYMALVQFGSELSSRYICKCGFSTSRVPEIGSPFGAEPVLADAPADATADAAPASVAPPDATADAAPAGVAPDAAAGVRKKGPPLGRGNPAGMTRA